ncbi:hypothetical protein [Arthrobacter flavus]|uniref:Lipoprotein n=1 Tax=Arthrobacter flavus TaxID=95172 RepID=A0ABW4Q628_9MICC
MRSSRWFVFVATVPLLAITACTSSPDPSPNPQTSSSAVPCIPAAGEITWQSASDAGFQLIGLSEFVIAADGTTTRSDTVLDHEVELIDINPLVVSVYQLDDRDDLFTALVEDVRRTGQVPEGFGEPIDPFAFADAEPAPNEGRYFMGFEVMTTRVPFEADCGGGLIKGSLRGPISGGGSATLIQCGYVPESQSPVDPQLRSYC